MRFIVAGILARCVSCGNHEFAPLGLNRADRANRLACTDCCIEVTLDDLLAQIARAVISDTRAA